MKGDIHSTNARGLVDLNELLKNHMGFKGVYLFEQLTNLAVVRDYADICTKGKVYLNSIINRTFVTALQNNSPGDIDEFFLATSDIPILYEGGKEGKVSFREIIAIYPMPGGDPIESELAAVDLEDGDDFVSNGNQTVAEMITEHYLCQNDQEAEKYLRRFLASR